MAAARRILFIKKEVILRRYNCKISIFVNEHTKLEGRNILEEHIFLANRKICFHGDCAHIYSYFCVLEGRAGFTLLPLAWGYHIPLDVGLLRSGQKKLHHLEETESNVL